jgi:hypothetical protein
LTPSFGIASGAAHIFGATQAAYGSCLRTVYELLPVKTAKPSTSMMCAALISVKEAEYDLNGTKVRVAVTRVLPMPAKFA